MVKIPAKLCTDTLQNLPKLHKKKTDQNIFHCYSGDKTPRSFINVGETVEPKDIPLQ